MVVAEMEEAILVLLFHLELKIVSPSFKHFFKMHKFIKFDWKHLGSSVNSDMEEGPSLLYLSHFFLFWSLGLRSLTYRDLGTEINTNYSFPDQLCGLFCSLSSLSMAKETEGLEPKLLLSSTLHSEVSSYTDKEYINRAECSWNQQHCFNICYKMHDHLLDQLKYMTESLSTSSLWIYR